MHTYSFEMKNVWFQFISITYIVLDTFGILLSNCQIYDDWSDPQNLTLLEHFLRYHLGKIETGIYLDYMQNCILLK